MPKKFKHCLTVAFTSCRPNVRIPFDPDVVKFSKDEHLNLVLDRAEGRMIFPLDKIDYWVLEKKIPIVPVKPKSQEELNEPVDPDKLFIDD